MSLKEYSTLPKYPELEPHHQITVSYPGQPFFGRSSFIPMAGILISTNKLSWLFLMNIHYKKMIRVFGNFKNKIIGHNSRTPKDRFMEITFTERSKNNILGCPASLWNTLTASLQTSKTALLLWLYGWHPFLCEWAPARESLCLFWHETHTKSLGTRSPTEPGVDEGRKVSEKTERVNW